MRLLWLDYQQAPPGQKRPGLVVLTLGIGAVLFVAAQYWQASQALAAGEARVAAQKRASQQRELLARSATQSADALRTQQLSASATRWESLFSALEAAADENVTLLGLAPGAKDIAINGEAKNLDGAMDYVKRLQNTAVLVNAHMSEYSVDKENPQHPVKFTVAAQWSGALS